MCRNIIRGVMRDAVRERHREAHDMHLDTAEIEVSAEKVDVNRSKVFNFYSM